MRATVKLNILVGSVLIHNTIDRFILFLHRIKVDVYKLRYKMLGKSFKSVLLTLSFIEKKLLQSVRS